MSPQEMLCECGQRSGTNSDCTSCRFVDTERKISAELTQARATIERLRNAVRHDMDNYAETMDKLAAPTDWDVPGIIADVATRLKEDGDGEAAAVIDTLAHPMSALKKEVERLWRCAAFMKCCALSGEQPDMTIEEFE